MLAMGVVQAMSLVRVLEVPVVVVLVVRWIVGLAAVQCRCVE